MLSITAVGNVCYDPETRQVGNLDVCNFTILVNKKRKDEEFTTPIKCAVWGPRAKFAYDLLKKGQQVTVTGQAHLESYASNKTGETRYQLNMEVNDFRLPPKPKVDADAMPF
jgi:single stranded DNA-binding protein